MKYNSGGVKSGKVDKCTCDYNDLEHSQMYCDVHGQFASTPVLPKTEEKNKGFTLDELFEEVEKSTKDGTNPMLLPVRPEIEPLDKMVAKGTITSPGDGFTRLSAYVRENREKINEVIKYLNK